MFIKVLFISSGNLAGFRLMDFIKFKNMLTFFSLMRPKGKYTMKPLLLCTKFA